MNSKIETYLVQSSNLLTSSWSVNTPFTGFSSLNTLHFFRCVFLKLIMFVENGVFL